MNCGEFTALLADFVEGDLPPATRTGCEEHRAVCRDCCRYLKGYAGTIRLARSAFRRGEPAAAIEEVDALVVRILERTAPGNGSREVPLRGLRARPSPR